MATQIVFNSRIPGALAKISATIREAVEEVFATQIHPAAVEKSPVTPEGLARNLELEALGKLGDRPPGGTGTNRRSIDYTVETTEKGTEAKLFTQDGYGGYLETGTSKMRAQPYLWPAFIENVDKIPQGVKVKIEGIGTKKSE
jgi:HK97 gp10 family phage protein